MHSRRRASWSLVAVFALGAVSPLAAQGKPDFDVRGPRANALPSAPAKLPPGQQRALDDLRGAAGKDVVVKWSELTGAPSRIHKSGRPLSLPSKAAAKATANAFLARYRDLFNLSPDDTRDMRFTRDFKTSHNGAEHLTLQQRVEGRDVFGGRLKINLDAQGRVVAVSGEPMPDVNAKVNALEAAISGQDAIDVAASAAGVSRASKTTIEGLVYFPRDAHTLKLAWHVYVENADSPDGYDSLVDAVDGTLLWRRNRTQYNHIAAHGLVFPSDSPQPNTPKGTLFTDTREDLPFNGGLRFGHNDFHYDWWDGATRDTTTGNNIDAFLDRDNDDAPDASCTSCSGTSRPSVAGENFNSPEPDFATEDPVDHQEAALVSAFHWTNRIHDYFYRMGFDEASGNFQDNNFGLGGSDSDHVNVHVQDGADIAPPDTPYCNANMNTGVDGSSPRMQLYLCDNTNPIRDSAFEAGTMTHEYGHGVHSRLVPLSGRQNPQEGVGDYFALSMLGEVTDPYDGAYGYGGQWVRGITSGDGIRSAPYSTDPAIFPRTYADINDASSCQFALCTDGTTLCDEDADCAGTDTCGTAPTCLFDTDCDSPPQTVGDRGPCTVSVHHTGELWANPLWIGRMNLIEKHGFESGRRIMDKLVIDGMKFSPDDPSMLDGRDAILFADYVSNSGNNICLLWSAFAQMGMGFSAQTTGNDDINPLEAFDLPSECTAVMQLNAPLAFGSVCIGDFKTNTLTLFNTGNGDLLVSSVSRTAGSTDITIDVPPTPPVVIHEGSHIDFTVRCAPTTAGAKTATITIESNDLAQPTVNLEYTCNGGSPNIVTTFAAGGSFGDVCLGNIRDLDLTIHNSGNCPLSVGAIGSSDVEFVVGAVGVYPLVIDGGDTTTVPIRFQPVTDTIVETANITISSNDPDDDSHVVAVTGNSPAAVPTIFMANSNSFGNVCVESFHDLDVTVSNAGACPLDVTGLALTGLDAADWELPTLFTTVVLEPQNVFHFPLRFAPDDFAAPIVRTASLDVSSKTHLLVGAPGVTSATLGGTAPPPDINVPAATATLEFGNTCADELAEKTVDVCNVGLCTLDVTAAELFDNDVDLGVCDDFEIVANPFPSEVSHDFCMGIVVRYTPTEEGEHTCVLRITSNDPDEPAVFVTLHGETSDNDALIDIPESIYFNPEVVSSVDVCETRKPLVINNNGECPIVIEDLYVAPVEDGDPKTEDFFSEDPDAFALEGVPSFPLPLQSGHTLGDGDLRAIFAPDPPLDRDKLGKIVVEYVSDQVTGDTALEDIAVCGEATLTGARVLVRYQGQDYEVVERIQIQRVTGNRNRRPQLDTVSVWQNVGLQEETPAAPCVPFNYHVEFGGVDNQVQLVPGFYQVTATIRVGGHRRTKTVAFSVNACDFNPSVVINF